MKAEKKITRIWQLDNVTIHYDMKKNTLNLRYEKKNHLNIQHHNT